jgi:hypothetical protein
MSDSHSQSASEHVVNQTNPNFAIPDISGVVPTTTEARAKRRIAALEEELQTMRQERGKKQRCVTYCHRQYPSSPS